MSRNERTVSFALWPHLITVEGPADRIAALLESLYKDGRLARDSWSLATSEGAGRLVTIGRLRLQGKLARRLGMAAVSYSAFEAIEHRARRSGLRVSTMHLPTFQRRTAV